MQQQNYTSTIVTAKTAAEVFTAITGVNKWWTENIDGNTIKTNDTFTVTFGETYMKLKVTEVVTNQRITWLVTDSFKHFLSNNKNEWNGTCIMFDIEIRDYRTILHFTHNGLTPQLECFEICNDGWNHYLNSLKQLIATGTGNADVKV